MSLLLPILASWSTASWASSPLERLRETLEQEENAPSMALACGEIGELQAGLQDSAAGNLAVVAMESRLPYSSSGQQAREWIRVIRSGGLEGLGLDTERSVLVELWLDEVEGYRARVPMSGSDEQVQDLMEQIFRDHLVDTDAGWMVRPWDPTVEGPWVAELTPTEEGNDLLFVKGAQQSQTSPPASILDELPDDDGCYFAIRLNQEEPIGLTSAMAALTGDETRPVVLRVQTDLEMHRSFREGYGRPLGGHSTEEPFVVLGLGISPFDLIDIPLLRDTIGDDFIEQARLLQRYIQLPAGATLAVFGDRQEPEFLLVLPILNARGRTIRPRRLNRIIRRGLPEEMQYERIAMDAFSARFDDRTVYARVNSGHLVLGYDEQRVEETAEGVGEPWLTNDDLEWIETLPISIKFHTPNQVPFMSDGIGGLVGLQAQDGLVELSMLPSTSLRTTLPSLLAMGAGIAIPRFITMQHRAKREELMAHVGSIHAAMLEVEASTLTEATTACTIEVPSSEIGEDGSTEPMTDCTDSPLRCISTDQIVGLLLPNDEQQTALTADEPFLWVRSPWGTEPIRLGIGDEVGPCGGRVTDFEVRSPPPDESGTYAGTFTIREDYSASNGVVVRTRIHHVPSRGLGAATGVDVTYMPINLRTLSFGEETESFGDEAESIILPATPRAVEELDPEPVDWNPADGWELFPWVPEYSVRGSYWIERRSDGSFEVHGQADIDGDGEPSHVVQGQDESEPVMLTDPSLY